MDARQLEIFVKVAELGSFSKAAEALFLTQPTVSEHIRGLEEELGAGLLDRLGRGAAPTKAGQLLLGYGRRILELHREARQALDQFQGRMSGELVIAASTIPGEYVLPALIGRFKEKYPDIAISLLIGDTQRVVEWVLGGRGSRAAHRARAGVGFTACAGEGARRGGSGSQRLQGCRRDGLHAGHQAGGEGGGRDLADLQARGGGGVPARDPALREGEGPPLQAGLLSRHEHHAQPLASGRSLPGLPDLRIGVAEHRLPRSLVRQVIGNSDLSPLRSASTLNPARVMAHPNGNRKGVTACG